MTDATKCYMCSSTAVSKEHVPPKCLFPEPKDVGGLNFKKELITVPSCENHNMAKSHDDEFLMFSLAGILNNNSLGQLHFHTKVNRALRRKEKDFLNKQVIRNFKYKQIKTIDNKVTIALMGHPNYDRLVKCFENISFGIFFEEFKIQFIGEINMILGFIDYKDDNMQTFKNLIKRRFEVEKELLENQKGQNPNVFYYQFCRPDENGLIALKIVFYEKSEVYISFKPDNSIVPYNLTFDLLTKGIKTVINVDNEEFKFNSDNW